MKGDFSRQTFDPRKHYSGVLMQQGRVQTDADWNEQEAIERHRLHVETRDIVGRCGAPVDDAGFDVAVAGGKLTIGAGRYYVDGLLAENETDGLAYEAQPDLPAAPDWTEALAKAGATLGLVYLDIWERHITPLDDALLREVALGGPDTATRVKTVWQVRVLPIVSAVDSARLKKLKAQLADLQQKLADMITQNAPAADIAAIQGKISAVETAIAELGTGPTCEGQFGEWDDLVADPARTLNARTQPPTAPDGPCVVPPTAGYRRLENQLYRVEVHEPGAPGVATFKWSRDDGSVVTAIEKISGKDVTVHDLGPDEVLGFAGGQWVEIADDASELAGVPGQLAQIDAVNSSLRRITLKTAPTPLDAGADGVNAALHPKLRRWDQSGTTATADGVAVTATWLPLEDGVEVQFSGGPFRTGDYWVIPARAATGEIEWPPFAVPNTSPEAQPRRGIQHHYCRLALLEPGAANDGWTVNSDCRALFPPLTASCCVRDSLHVVGTNWRNDDRFDPQRLATEGLRIQLDAGPEAGSLTNDTVQIAIETAFQSGGTTTTTNPNLLQRIYVRGLITRDPNDPTVIVWRPQPTPGTPDHLAAPAAKGRRPARAGRAAPKARLDALGELTTRFTAVELALIRLRVTLKGQLIWSDPKLLPGRRVFLDGVAFGGPGQRALDGSPRIALEFPSGHGGAATDFESWLFFGARESAKPLQATTVRFLNANQQPSSAGDVPMPTDGHLVRFKAGEGIQFVQITFNRPVLKDSLIAAAGADSQFNVSIKLLADGPSTVLSADVRLESENVVRYTLRDPQFFSPGQYILTCNGGTNADGVATGLRAADDNSGLDGDYDGAPGGDMKLPFMAI